MFLSCHCLFNVNEQRFIVKENRLFSQLRNVIYQGALNRCCCYFIVPESSFYICWSWVNKENSLYISFWALIPKIFSVHVCVHRLHMNLPAGHNVYLHLYAMLSRSLNYNSLLLLTLLLQCLYEIYLRSFKISSYKATKRVWFFAYECFQLILRFVFL